MNKEIKTIVVIGVIFGCVLLFGLSNIGDLYKIHKKNLKYSDFTYQIYHKKSRLKSIYKLLTQHHTELGDRYTLRERG